MRRVDCGQRRSGSREARQMLLVGESRHRVVRLRLEPRPHDAAFSRGGQNRQARAGDQVVDQRRQEHRLARARQASDAEAQRPAGEIIADRAGDEPRLEHEIAETWQGKIRTANRGAYLGGARRFGQWAGLGPQRQSWEGPVHGEFGSGRGSACQAMALHAEFPVSEDRDGCLGKRAPCLKLRSSRGVFR